MGFPTKWYVRPARAQTSLRIRAVWSERLLVAWIFYECLATDRTSFGVSKLKRRLHRLVWVYTCQNATLLGNTCRGSNYYLGINTGCTGFCWVMIQSCCWWLQQTSSVTKLTRWPLDTWGTRSWDCLLWRLERDYRFRTGAPLKLTVIKKCTEQSVRMRWLINAFVVRICKTTTHVFLCIRIFFFIRHMLPI